MCFIYVKHIIGGIILMKKSVALLTVIGTLLFSANVAFADQVNIEPSMNDFNEDVKIISIEDLKLNKAHYELIINQSTQQYKYLRDWGNTFRYLGDGKLSAVGYTEAKQNVDTISTTVYLQQYDESRNAWVNIDYKTNSESNHYYSLTSRSYIAPIGFRYRLFAVHKVTVNGVTESVSSYSSAIKTY